MIYDWDIEKIGNQDRTYVMKIVVTFIQFVIASFLLPPHQWLPPRDQAIYTTELIVGKQCNIWSLRVEHSPLKFLFVEEK